MNRHEFAIYIYPYVQYITRLCARNLDVWKFNIRLLLIALKNLIYTYRYFEILRQDICSVVSYFISLGSDCTLLLKYAICVLESGRFMVKKEQPIVTMYFQGEYKKR